MAPRAGFLDVFLSRLFLGAGATLALPPTVAFAAPVVQAVAVSAGGGSRAGVLGGNVLITWFYAVLVVSFGGNPFWKFLRANLVRLCCFATGLNEVTRHTIRFAFCCHWRSGSCLSFFFSMPIWCGLVMCYSVNTKLFSKSFSFFHRRSRLYHYNFCHVHGQ
jgi:hypothetical protein